MLGGRDRGAIHPHRLTDVTVAVVGADAEWEAPGCLFDATDCIYNRLDQSCIEAPTVAIGFEWDERKRIVNLETHGIDFRDAIGVFERPHLTRASPRGDELRQVSLGVIGRAVVAVVWTDRDGAIRIISVRAARRDERYIYETRFGLPG